MPGTPNASLLIQELTGTWMVYPGHPLVVATVIMHVFPDYPSASVRSGDGYSAALGDVRIPGAGDHVGAALRTLALGAAGKTVADMIAYAAQYWTRGRAGGHPGNVESGSAQAEAIRPHFEQLAAQWFAAAAAQDEPLPSGVINEGGRAMKVVRELSEDEVRELSTRSGVRDYGREIIPYAFYLALMEAMVVKGRAPSEELAVPPDSC